MAEILVAWVSGFTIRCMTDADGKMRAGMMPSHAMHPVRCHAKRLQAPCPDPRSGLIARAAVQSVDLHGAAAAQLIGLGGGCRARTHTCASLLSAYACAAQTRPCGRGPPVPTASPVLLTRSRPSSCTFDATLTMRAGLCACKCLSTCQMRS